MKYSEYIFCEDLVCVFKFFRLELEYCECYCLEKDEFLRCFILVFLGYKNFFWWLESCDYVWYVNIFYKELMVEKVI